MIDWNTCAKAFDDKAAEKLCKSRGYSEPMVGYLRDHKLVGLYKGMIAFRTAHEVIGEYGAHYKTKTAWAYTEGAKVTPFVIGQIEEGAHVHCFESQWDAIALADTGDRDNVVASRGAGNARLIIDAVGKDFSGTLYLWPQNDAPGRKWADDVRRLFKGQVKIVETPKEYKDLCEWHKADPNPDAVFEAYRNAKDFPVTLLDAGQPTSEPRCAGDVHSPSTGVLPVAGKDFVAPGSALNKQPEPGETPDSPLNDPRNPVLGASQTGADTVATTNLTAVPVLAEPQGNHEAKTHREQGGEARESTQPLPTVEQGYHDTPLVTADSRGGGQDLQKGGDLCKSSRLPLAVTNDAAPTVQPAGAAGIVNLAQCLDSIVLFMCKYMRFESDWEPVICALWVAHTWLFSAFSYTPYLHIMSPEKRCGKSRLLDLFDLLCHSPWLCLRPSEAVMYRKIHKDKPTLLMDEIDTVFGEGEANEPIRAMLNGGYANGIKVPRCIGKTGDFEEFSVFCPKAIAGIGVLPDTVGDRCIHIPLARQPSEDRAERFRRRDAEIEVQAIRVFLKIWSETSFIAMSRARPKLPDLDGRHMDIAEPLLAVAEAASEEWAEKARDAVVIAFDQDEIESESTLLLKLIKEYFLNHSGDKVTTIELLNALVKRQHPDATWTSYWEKQLASGQINGPSQKLAKMLRNFKTKDGHRIRSHTLNIGDGETVRGFRRADFEHAWRTYLPQETKAEAMELGLVA